MKINESAEMIPLYNIEPSNSFYYHPPSLPQIPPIKHPLSSYQVIKLKEERITVDTKYIELIKNYIKIVKLG